MADFFNKLNEDQDIRIIRILSENTSIALYLLATGSIICFPYMNSISSLTKDALDKMSTVSSVIALGLVFVSIGYSNRREMFKDAKKRDDHYENLLTNFEDATSLTSEQVKIMSEQATQLLEQTEQVSDKTKGLYKIIEEKDKKIEELEKKIKTLEKIESTPSV
ncbi:hypothetical protein [Bacillus sp. XF8]|uniref:hypothetical protein n=1 Tax=Bacillus sp. XF8 TaxID=2819289 RepID=UPI001AA06F5A|nr:hypothetical protein [Bacillus sp. XF8]MBO1582550.1 hypothetical protein [Bacillus sp. XF8]